MKKGVLFVIFIFLFLLVFPLLSAAVNATAVNNGFSCLANKTTDCSSLSLGEQIFTSLATGRCTSYISNSMSNEGCWPSGSCNIKTTSEAMLALNKESLSTNTSKLWLLSQNHTTSDIVWYLQIDSNQAATCSISYLGSSNTVHIGQDKKIQESSVGSCLTRSSNGYWLTVSPSCFGTDFLISCNQSFTTTRLYQRVPVNQYPTIYVSSFSQSASSGATVTDSVNSYCFGSGGTCDYESTLWASLVLDRLGYDISYYIPYLTVEAGDSSNSPYLPYAFLYSLTSSPDYLTKLLAAQKIVNDQKYWTYSNDPYFGTSLALLAIKSTDSADSDNAINWLLSVQGRDGCWNNGNILNTAFVLYSAFGPRALAGPSGGGSSHLCTDVGYCLSTLSCNQIGGSIFSDYSASCPGIQICCSKNIVSQTCSEQQGQLCDSGQVCDGSPISSSDSTSDKVCCIGTCITPSTSASNSCDSLGGICRNSCLSDEGVSSGVCSISSQLCCVKSIASSQSQSKSRALIIVLVVLIVLVSLGIIFRKRLTPLWLRIKSKFFKGKGGPQRGKFGPRRPPFPPSKSLPSSFRRRPPMYHPQNPSQRRPTSRSSEVSEVLKKLREMGK